MSDYNRLHKACIEAGYEVNENGTFDDWDTHIIIEDLRSKLKKAYDKIAQYKKINKGCAKCTNLSRIKIKNL